MRIVGGEFRGRPLAAPRSQDIRPTTDRTREAVFNVVAHRFADRLSGARVLDLFAGTGALGLEAMSRGAAFCMFIEELGRGQGRIRTNVEAFGLTGRTKISGATRRASARPATSSRSASFSPIRPMAGALAKWRLFGSKRRLAGPGGTLRGGGSGVRAIRPGRGLRAPGRTVLWRNGDSLSGSRLTAAAVHRQDDE